MKCIYVLLILSSLGSCFNITKTSKKSSATIKNSIRIYGYNFKDNNGNVIDLIYGTKGRGKTLCPVPMLVYYRKETPHPELMFINDSIYGVAVGNNHYTVSNSPVVFFKDGHASPIILSNSWALKYIKPDKKNDLEIKIKYLLDKSVNNIKK